MTMKKLTGNPVDPKEKCTTIHKGPGVSWQQKEEHVIPKNRLGIICFALVCTMFLAALDNTIIATALPTIAARLQGDTNYSWAGNAYMLSVGAFSPMYGKLSDMFGRKRLLSSCIFVFLIGSTLCGAAQDMTWLTICRAVQGIGGGGIMQLSIITMSDIVSLKDRARYCGLIGATYAIASVIGPVLGGVLTQYASWRWCFFINLPVGGVATALLLVFLNVHPPENRPLRDHIARFDFVGLFSLAPGVICLLLSLSFGEEDCNAWTISLFILGIVLFLIGGINEAFTKRSAILPSRLFKTRTTICLLMIGFLQNAVFMAAMFYLPLFYKVLGSSATDVGIKMLPYTLVASFVSAIAGVIVSRTKKTRPAIWFGSTLFALGTGLMIMLDYTSSIAQQAGFSVIAAVGIAFVIQTPVVALQAAMPLKDMATATSGFMFLRVLGGAVGLAVGESVLALVLPQKLAAIPNIASLGLGLEGRHNNSVTALIIGIEQVNSNPDDVLRDAVLHAWARSIASIWVVMLALSGSALVLTLLLREYSVDRKTVYSGEAKDATQTQDTAESEAVAAGKTTDEVGDSPC